MGGYRRFTSVVVVLATALALVATACSDEGSAGGGDTSTSAMPTQTATSSPPPTAEPIPAGPVSVEVAETEIGEVLVDGEGRTLYVFLVDRPGEPACLDACLDTWLPVYVKGKPAIGDGVGASVVGTSKRDGQMQLTIGDQYAYLYAGDESAGDTNGQGIESLWYTVAPDGTRVIGA